MLQEAIALIERDAPAEADAVLARLCRERPADPAPPFYRGVAAMKRQDWPQSAAHFGAAARLAPAEPRLLRRLAEAHQRCGAMAAAAAARLRALALQPASDDDREALARARKAAGDPGGAARLLEGLADRRPAAGLWAELGHARHLAGDAAGAAGAYRRALTLAPQAGPVRRLLAELLHRDGRAAETAALFRDALALPAAPAARADMLEALGIALRDLEDWSGAACAFDAAVRLRRGRPLAEGGTLSGAPAPAPLRRSRLTAPHKLAFDAAQLAHLRAESRLPASVDPVIDAHHAVLAGLTQEQRAAGAFDLDDAQHGRIAATYNRLLHVEASGWTADRPALDPALDWAALDAAYPASSPSHVVIDGILAPDALAALRRFCWGSTIWFGIKTAGYVGAILREGFTDPLLFRIAAELRERLPRTLGPHRLRQLWAYSYDQDLKTGINPHADFAAVNVNLWIAPDEANLEPETGGLLVYDSRVPDDWSFEAYNHAPAQAIYDHLGPARDTPIRVPHRANRALMFDSALFHESDRFRFRPGLTNRRINITFLYGTRQ